MFSGSGAEKHPRGMGRGFGTTPLIGDGCREISQGLGDILVAN